MKFKSALVAACVGAMTLASTGCFQREKEIEVLEGTLKSEFGTAHLLAEADSIDPRNTPLMPGELNYGIVIESEGEKYTIMVRNTSGKPILAQAKAYEPGDTLKITFDKGITGPMPEDNIVHVYSSNIDRINPKE